MSLVLALLLLAGLFAQPSGEEEAPGETVRLLVPAEASVTRAT